MSEGGGEGAGGFFQQLVTSLGYEVDTGGLESLKHSLEQIAERTKLLLAVEVVKGVGELIERFAGLGESLESSAISAGLTTDELQKLQFAASQNAIGSEQLNGALARLGRQLFQAQRGSKSAVDAFARLGISKEQIAGFGSAKDALYAIQDGVGQLGSQQEKLAVVQQLFGRGGSKFLKFLQEGSVQTKRLEDRAESMGAVITGDGVKALAEFEDAASGLGQVLRAFLGSVAGAFAPGFVAAIESIEDAWARNKQIISDGLSILAQRFAFALGFIKGLIEDTSDVVSAILYRKGGIGDYVKSTASLVIDTVRMVAGVLGKVFQGIQADGSLSALFADIKTLVVDLASVFAALAKSVLAAFGQVAQLFSGNTDKIGAINTALRGLIATIDALVVALDALAVAGKFWFGGEAGNALGQTKLGDAFRFFTDAKFGPVAPALLQKSQTLVQNLLPATETMAKMAVPAPSAGATPMMAGGQARPTSIVSNTTVNVPAGMTGEQAAELFGQKHREALLDALNEADRDSTPAWQY